ncbi:MAG: helix-turn-helix transcriptional regulator [Planctomycetota bacterium]
MKILTEVGRLIRKHRNAKGWSQEELADRAGVHRTFISSIERGVRNPTVTSLHRIASAMGLTVSELMDGLRKGRS